MLRLSAEPSFGVGREQERQRERQREHPLAQRLARQRLVREQCRSVRHTGAPQDETSPTRAADRSSVLCCFLDSWLPCARQVGRNRIEVGIADLRLPEERHDRDSFANVVLDELWSHVGALLKQRR